MATNDCHSPAFIVDILDLNDAVSRFLIAVEGLNSKVLYAVKACSLASVVEQVGLGVNGFATSSLFEARLARGLAHGDQTVHFTSPGLSDMATSEIATLCDYVAFNSVEQLRRAGPNFSLERKEPFAVGLRVNPQMSFVEDPKFDPCRPSSKLGVPIEFLAEQWKKDEAAVSNVSGLLIHSNSESEDWSQLEAVVGKCEGLIPDALHACEWINLGGGYIIEGTTDITPLRSVIQRLNERYGLTVFIEPGFGIVNNSCDIVTSVVDILRSDGQAVAVVDTSVNHVPEVFEYQYSPAVAEASEHGEWTYVLAGCTCLPGDVFGEYRFDRELRVGERLTFKFVGAYSFVKAHMFNGINLPTVYVRLPSGELVMEREFTYEDYASRMGVKKDESLRERV
ncbi:MAG: carboxynorspermidine decarboxylase [Armatimonadetes bacterium]|nr:carboxynorspermidine decarboxylase [Armatimonadota bacterium]